MRTMEPYLAYTMAEEGGKKLYLHHMLQFAPSRDDDSECKTHRNMPTGPQASY